VHFPLLVGHYGALDALARPVAHHLLLRVFLRLGIRIFLDWAAEWESVQLRLVEVDSATLASG